MPESNDNPSDIRKGGQFYSQVARQERWEHLVLTEVEQPTGLKIQRHEHELDYVSVVLDGYYAETNIEGSIELPPFTAIFNPSGVEHTAVVGQKGTRFFTVELNSGLLKQIDIELPGHPMVDLKRGALLWPALRMFWAFKSQTADPLILESHLMEMFGAFSSLQFTERTAPSWFSRVKDQLHSQFRENIRICDLAAEAGVHPVHLARVFRRQEGLTPGDYVQKLRIHAACKLLNDQETSLAGVATECGFADQSHFTRVFKKIMSSTPSQFRKIIFGNSASCSEKSFTVVVDTN